MSDEGVAPRQGAENFRWLVHLRWAAVVGQLVTVLVVHGAFGIELPLGWLLALIAAEALSNAAFELWLRGSAPERGGVPWESAQGTVMLVDVLFLTALLWLTGGVANPFSLFYLVNIVLAAVLLRPRWAWTVAGVALAGYLFLFLEPHPLRALEERGALASRGLAVAFAGVVVNIAYFVSRISTALRRRDRELVAERARKAESERLESLATLAAGAGHELATPLSTIAVVAKELERVLAAEGAGDESMADARLIRQEVERCRAILERMRVDAGSSAGESIVPVAVHELLATVVAELPSPGRVDLALAASARAAEIVVPRAGLAMALRGIVKNALDASPPGAMVELAARCENGAVVVTVTDRGHGMDPAVAQRAFDPFFTTKEPGAGMGLGLYLARTTIERVGGAVELATRRGAGTKVVVRLPLAT